jgi:transcriptional regulator with XRE-family HTH domain
MIGSKITKQRKELNLTQLELAEKIYVTPQAVSKWEKGKSVPSIEILIELTKLFNISIDYLLDDSEIKEHDYESMFNNYSRAAALNKFLNSESPSKQVNKIFYLLDETERELIINYIISKKLLIDLEDIWPYLTNPERKYILGVVLTNKYDYNISSISHQLSNEEKRICYKHKTTYKYPLFNFHFTIKE